MPWALAADVKNAWIGEGAPTDDTKINLWIGKAEREVKFRISDIETRIAAEAAEDPAVTTLVDLAKDVVVAMVTRVFRNPENLRQTTVTTGPFSESRTLGGDTPGELHLTDAEMKKLSDRQGGAFEIDLDSRRRRRSS
jgi:hypothetical protein